MLGGSSQQVWRVLRAYFRGIRSEFEGYPQQILKALAEGYLQSVWRIFAVCLKIPVAYFRGTYR